MTASLKRSTARKEFLHGIFVTAMEGGIGYWSQARGYHWSIDGAGEKPDLDGFRGVLLPTEETTTDDGRPCWGFFDSDDEDVRPLVLDAAVIARGVTRFVAKYTPIIAKDPSDYWHQFMAANRTNGEQGDYDADVADTVVQLGLFGEIVYS